MNREDKHLLIEEASKARRNAYVPNSGFRVGAALLTETGKIITGSNMELMNMPESICAERCAITKATSMGYHRFAAIAIVSDAPEPIAPCGFCRQTMIDFGSDWSVLMSDPGQNNIIETTVGELLPYAFIGSKYKPEKKE